MATGWPGLFASIRSKALGGGVEVAAFHGLLCLGEFRLAELVQAGRPVAVGIVLRARRGLAAGTGQPELLRDLEHLAEPLAHLRLGQGAEEAGRQLAADHGQHHRDALHLQCRAELRVGVHVHLGEDPGPGGFAGQPLQHRAELLAGPAPLGPQVHDHGDGAGALQHVRLECRLCHVEHVLAVGSTLAGGGWGLLALRGRLAGAEVDGAVQREVPRLLHDSILPHPPALLGRDAGHRRRFAARPGPPPTIGLPE